MAERRMFAKTIVLSDAFLDMPVCARLLYFTLGMVADDDGFVNSPKSIMRQIGASEDDMRILVAKRYILPFDDGVIVIKHWRINNYLQTDRTKPTLYYEHRNDLALDEKNAYVFKSEQGQTEKANENSGDVYTAVYTQSNIEQFIASNNNSIAPGARTREGKYDFSYSDIPKAYLDDVLPRIEAANKEAVAMSWWARDKENWKPTKTGSFDTDEFFNAAVSRSLGAESEDV